MPARKNDTEQIVNAKSPYGSCANCKYLILLSVLSDVSFSVSDAKELVAIRLPDIVAAIAIIWMLNSALFVSCTTKGINNPKVPYEEPVKKAKMPEKI